MILEPVGKFADLYDGCYTYGEYIVYDWKNITRPLLMSFDDSKTKISNRTWEAVHIKSGSRYEADSWKELENRLI